MNELTSDRISQLVIDALERTAFVLVDIVDEERVAELSKPVRFSKVAFSGAANGQVVLSATDGFVCELASSILGVEPTDVKSDVEGLDALNELSNIVGGSIILDMGGEDHHIVYGLPTTIESSEVPGHCESTVRCYLECDEELLTVAWYPQSSEQAKAA